MTQFERRHRSRNRLLALMFTAAGVAVIIAAWSLDSAQTLFRPVHANPPPTMYTLSTSTQGTGTVSPSGGSYMAGLPVGVAATVRPTAPKSRRISRQTSSIISAPFNP